LRLNECDILCSEVLEARQFTTYSLKRETLIKQTAKLYTQNSIRRNMTAQNDDKTQTHDKSAILNEFVMFIRSSIYQSLGERMSARDVVTGFCFQHYGESRIGSRNHNFREISFSRLNKQETYLSLHFFRSFYVTTCLRTRLHVYLTAQASVHKIGGLRQLGALMATIMLSSDKSVHE
jgi:hypothetical protein